MASFFWVSLTFVEKNHVVEYIEASLCTKRDISFLLAGGQQEGIEFSFLSEEWCSPQDYMFLKAFVSYSWNTDHREEVGLLRLFPPFEVWFLELLCRYSRDPSYRYEDRYLVWQGEISFSPCEAKNSTPGSLLLTSTLPLVLTKKVMRPLASFFPQERLRDLFSHGKIPLEIEFVDRLLPLAPLLKKRFVLSLPVIEERFDVVVEMDLRELQEGFFEMVAWVVVEGQRFPFLYEEFERSIAHKQRIFFQSREKLWFLSWGSPGYEKIRQVTCVTLEKFSRFLGEVKQQSVQTHDMHTLFENYLDCIAPFVRFVPLWRKVEWDRVSFEVQSGEDMDWLEVNFEVILAGKPLSSQERKHLVRYGYLKRPEGWISLSAVQRKWLQEVEEAWFLQQQEEKVRLRLSHVFLLRELVGRMKEGEPVLVLPPPYQDLPLQGDILDVSIPLPQKVESFLRPYQKTGYWWLHFLYRYHFGGFLADEMGLGKTLQIIAFLLSIKTHGQSLIVCPSALVHNWAKEITKFAGNELRFLVMDGSVEKRKEKQQHSDHYEVLITSYSLLHQDRDFYHNRVFHLCVLDEAQHVKNKKAKRTQSLKLLRAVHRVAITGTPMENTIMEMWTIFDFLMPGFLGTYAWFSKTFLGPLQSPLPSQREEAIQKLKTLIKPFVLRRTKDEVLSELPPKIEQEVWLDLTDSQKALYLHTVETIRALCERYASFSPQKAMSHFLAGLTRLRQICLHPVLAGHEVTEEPIKLRALRELLLEALDSDHRVVVFSQFVELLQIVRKQLEEISLEVLYLDGRTKHRVALVDSFNESQVPVFLISTKAGGTGLTITGADTVILLDPWWNPSVEKQAVDRVHRFGQKRTVHIFRLFTEGTIEEKMLLLQKRKKGLFQALITNNMEFLTHLSWQDLLDLLQMPGKFL
ncbi:MAG: DEAD/DEAH box helicase [Brevinematales bacterium]|nr:DEAD/DEAH box helicase [Brevinematales bacterium]